MFYDSPRLKQLGKILHREREGEGEGEERRGERENLIHNIPIMQIYLNNIEPDIIHT